MKVKTLGTVLLTPALLLGAGFAACSTGSGVHYGDGVDGGTDITAETWPVEQCRATVQAKLAEVQAAGIDVATWPIDDAPTMAEITAVDPQTPEAYTQYDGHYRPLTNHPGCSRDNLYYDKQNTSGTTPYKDGNRDGKWTEMTALGGPNQASDFADGDVADIPGYPCAAKQYTQPSEDPAKPIVILVHGNSTRPHSFEEFLLPPGTEIQCVEPVQFAPDGTVRTQLVKLLIAAGYPVLAVDLRTDLVTPAIEPMADNTTQNAAGNVDHGWSTPILQALLKAVMKNNPTRKVALIGHSLGVTVARDAVRRLYVEYARGAQGAVNPLKQISHMILGSGANHGVSTFESQCGANATMRGTVTCEMGSRNNYVETEFLRAINGPRDLFSTPCSDGDFAFGKNNQCGGNVIKYFTITMSDIETGKNYQDAYVSEAASKIDMPSCVENHLTTLNDFDTSGYFVKGMIANHFGSLRADAGIALAMQALAR